MSTTDRDFKQVINHPTLGTVATVRVYEDEHTPQLFRIKITTPIGRDVYYEIDNSYDYEHSHEVVAARFGDMPYRQVRPTPYSGLFYVAECGHEVCQEHFRETLWEQQVNAEVCCGEVNCSHVWSMQCRHSDAG